MGSWHQAGGGEETGTEKGIPPIFGSGFVGYGLHLCVVLQVIRQAEAVRTAQMKSSWNLTKFISFLLSTGGFGNDLTAASKCDYEEERSK